MANVSKKFIDPADGYNIYTSNVVEPISRRHSSDQTRGIFQASGITGTMSLQMRVSFDADCPWVTVKTYTADTIDEVVLGNCMRVVCTGTGVAWLGQVE